jgi:phosphatidylglycerophosphate synthase
MVEPAHFAALRKHYSDRQIVEMLQGTSYNSGSVIVMLAASRKANGEPPIIQDLNVIPALVILLREIIVSGLREFLAPLNVGVPVTALAKWKTTFQLVALGALILGGAFPGEEWIHDAGLISLWAAAALTMATGYDYLRIGLRHMD